MSSHSCDEFAADAIAVRDAIKAKHGVEIFFSIQQITNMVDEIDNQVESGVLTEHEELREVVLGHLHGMEYTAYKMLLDRIYKRRLAHA